MQGPTRPKHPDGEKLSPYQSGNTAPPPHPFYKKHDSTIPKKCRKSKPDSKICQKPSKFLLSKKKKVQGNTERVSRVGVGKKNWGIKRLYNIILFVIYFWRDYEKVCISNIYTMGWASGCVGDELGRGGGPVRLRTIPRIRLQKNKRRTGMEAGGNELVCFTLILWSGMIRRKKRANGKHDGEGGKSLWVSELVAETSTEPKIEDTWRDAQAENMDKCLTTLFSYNDPKKT